MDILYAIIRFLIHIFFILYRYGLIIYYFVRVYMQELNQWIAQTILDGFSLLDYINLFNEILMGWI